MYYNTCKFHPEDYKEHLGYTRECPMCGVEIVLGIEHPDTPPPPEKKAFLYYKRVDEVHGKEYEYRGGETTYKALDKAGWTTQQFLDAPTKLKIDRYTRESEADYTGEAEAVLNMMEQRVLLKSGRMKWNCLVYDIYQMGDDTMGWYKARRGTLKVQKVEDYWVEVSKHRSVPREYTECHGCGKVLEVNFAVEHDGLCLDCEHLYEV